MRYAEILCELAASPKGISKYESKGETFYITHRVEAGMSVHCGAYVVGKTPRDPARQKVAVASCSIHDRDDGKRNSLRVYSDKSFVEPEYRRYGLLSAMYDHLENYGFVVYPANGEIGDGNLQAQSDDAKAFWAKRQQNPSARKTLKPATEAELHGWNSPWANADQFEGMPVIEKVKVHGYESPMLVLYSKQFTTGAQKVGVMYTRARGYRVIITAENNKHNYTYDEMPWIDGDRMSIKNPYLDKIMKASVRTVALKLGQHCYPNVS